jgi:hypothetical protein
VLLLISVIVPNIGQMATRARDYLRRRAKPQPLRIEQPTLSTPPPNSGKA